MAGVKGSKGKVKWAPLVAPTKVLPLSKTPGAAELVQEVYWGRKRVNEQESERLSQSVDERGRQTTWKRRGKRQEKQERCKRQKCA